MFHIINGGRNKKTGGHNAFFSCGNPKKFFYAVLSTLPDHSIEILIFKADQHGNVTDWAEPLYTAYPPQVSHDELLKHIDLFAEGVTFFE